MGGTVIFLLHRKSENFARWPCGFVALLVYSDWPLLDRSCVSYGIGRAHDKVNILDAWARALSSSLWWIGIDRHRISLVLVVSSILCDDVGETKETCFDLLYSGVLVIANGAG